MRRSVVRWLVAVVIAAPLVGGCDVQVGTASSDGPTRSVCGQIVGRADDLVGSGPFYLDGGAKSVMFTARAGSAGTWVRVTRDCASGSRVELPVSASVNLEGMLPAPGGTDLAVLLAPVDPGDVVIRLIHADGTTTTVTEHVTTRIS